MDTGKFECRMFPLVAVVLSYYPKGYCRMLILNKLYDWPLVYDVYFSCCVRTPVPCSIIEEGQLITSLDDFVLAQKCYASFHNIQLRRREYVFSYILEVFLRCVMDESNQLAFFFYCDDAATHQNNIFLFNQIAFIQETRVGINSQSLLKLVHGQGFDGMGEPGENSHS